MKPRERRETGQSDLFKARLDQIIDMGHPRVRLAHRIDWGFLEQAFGAVYTDGPGSPLKSSVRTRRSPELACNSPADVHCLPDSISHRRMASSKTTFCMMLLIRSRRMRSFSSGHSSEMKARQNFFKTCFR